MEDYFEFLNLVKSLKLGQIVESLISQIVKSLISQIVD